MDTDALALPHERPPSDSLRSSLHSHTFIPNAVLGMLIFLGTEAMFFAGLISAFLVLRAGSAVWPPADQPRLPVLVTGLNTLILLVSAYTMWRALAAVRNDRQGELRRWLGVTGLLGTLFLAIQGTEWVRLLGYGLRMTSDVYGATFYTLIGCHGLHVLGGVIVLLAVLRQAIQGRHSSRDHAALEACRLYWFFVVGVWPILYVLVYLS
jgi:heme/copper-type cytochrome/quinol oxidase subunit 3